jgi:hypothetical protein
MNLEYVWLFVGLENEKNKSWTDGLIDELTVMNENDETEQRVSLFFCLN